MKLSKRSSFKFLCSLLGLGAIIPLHAKSKASFWEQNTCAQVRVLFDSIDTLQESDYSFKNAQFLEFRERLADLIQGMLSLDSTAEVESFSKEFSKCMSNEDISGEIVQNASQVREDALACEIQEHMKLGDAWTAPVKVVSTTLKLAYAPTFLVYDRETKGGVAPGFEKDVLVLGAGTLNTAAHLAVPVYAKTFMSAQVALGLKVLYGAAGRAFLVVLAGSVGYAVGDTLGWLSYRGVAKALGVSQQINRNLRVDALTLATDYLLAKKRSLPSSKQ